MTLNLAVRYLKAALKFITSKTTPTKLEDLLDPDLVESVEDQEVPAVLPWSCRALLVLQLCNIGSGGLLDFFLSREKVESNVMLKRSQIIPETQSSTITFPFPSHSQLN